MRTPWIMIVATGLALAGCATPGEQAERMEREMDRLIQVYGPACERLGYHRESDQWRDCVLRLAQRESRERYSTFPSTTSCFRSPGFLHCTTF